LKKPASFDRTAHEQREQQPDPHCRQNVIQREEERIADRLPGQPVVKERFPILESGKLGFSDDRPVHERKHETKAEREGLKHEKMKQNRHQNDVDERVFPPFFFQAGGQPGFRRDVGGIRRRICFQSASPRRSDWNRRAAHPLRGSRKTVRARKRRRLPYNLANSSFTA
jgi:hypothetical protein